MKRDWTPEHRAKRPGAVSALAIFVLGACSPVDQPGRNPPAAHNQSISNLGELDCLAAGGRMQRVGRLQAVQCVVTYADGGRQCSSGSQCKGDCVAEGSDLVAGQQASGTCQRTSSRFGCSTRVESGRALATLCVD